MSKLVLVNKEHKIKDNYFKRLELINTKNTDDEDIKVEKETYESYLKLKEFLANKNIEISIAGAYRSINEQQQIWDEFEEKYGKEYRNSHVAPPKTSEHHTGLAIDINIKVNGKFPEDNNEIEAQKEYYENIHKYLPKFGFILRYPKNKENITGYSYEPWHIRYVGKVVAKIITENNYTLEEYLNNYSGIIIVNKPKGLTSFDVVNEISHTLGIKRIGHTGTLDPLAEGVLVVTIGKATKIAELLTSTYKEYQAGVILGFETDTLDITGTITKSKTVPVTIEIEKALDKFPRKYLQEVPIYSAVKVNGKKLYEYARENKEVELPKKEVIIKELVLLNTDRNTFNFKCTVSKGCYVRSLIKDIANSINCYATMTSLIRTKQGNFSIDNANSLNEIKQGKFKLYVIEEALDYNVIKVDKELEFKIKNGQKLNNKFNIEDKVIFKNMDDKLLGIYQVKDNKLVVWKNF